MTPGTGARRRLPSFCVITATHQGDRSKWTGELQLTLDAVFDDMTDAADQ